MVFIASSLSSTMGAVSASSPTTSTSSEVSLLMGLVGFVGEVESDCKLPLLGDEACGMLLKVIGNYEE